MNSWEKGGFTASDHISEDACRDAKDGQMERANLVLPVFNNDKLYRGNVDRVCYRPIFSLRKIMAQCTG